VRIGALFAGYGGLEHGVQAALGGDVAWYSEVDKGALKILTHRYPDTPNIGDVTTVKWTPDCPTCGEPLALYDRDVPEGRGYYCPRDGWFDLDIRFADPELWSQMAYAIDQLRPALVVAENVRGLLSAEAHSDLEPCPWCMGDGEGLSPLRALGAVLGDLADLGYDAAWHGLRAADVGAPHGRFRVFVVAYPQGNEGRISHGDGGAAQNSDVATRGERWLAAPGETDSGGARPDAGGPDREEPALLGTPRCADGMRNDLRDPDNIGNPRGRLEDQVSLLPTPVTTDWNTAASRWDDPDHRSQLRDIDALLPTPRATDGTKGGPNQRGSSGDLMLPSAVQLLPTPRVTQPGYADDGRGGKSLDVEARLLPTPSVADVEGGRKSHSGERSDELLLNGIAAQNQWGDYGAAIARWEHTLGRPAPAPTQTSSKGNPQLAPAFVEWMMGLPAGWVTDTPGITRNEALKALGNGVVPLQAEAALRLLLDVLAAVA
jgi:DNA (cytosine-5)-methyltransferase 1